MGLCMIVCKYYENVYIDSIQFFDNRSIIVSIRWYISPFPYNIAIKAADDQGL